MRTQLAELGFLGMAMPEKFGGMELDNASVAAIVQELAWGEASTALMVAMHARAALILLQNGTDAQKTAWLERMASGEATACLALAEDDAGSDLTAITTTATKTADGYAITGSKRWVTNGANADVALVLAKVDDKTGIFVVDLQSANGMTRGEREDTLGLRPLPINTITFDKCDVPADALLGGTADAAKQLQSSADFERLTIAAIAVGIAEAALEHATGYADVREQFGQPLRAFEGMQFKLADMATRTAAAAALLQHAARAGDTQQTLMAKLFSTETAMAVTTQAVQVYGGYGYMRDYPVEKLMRDAKGMEILGGANELLRVAVAQALYQN